MTRNSARAASAASGPIPPSPNLTDGPGASDTTESERPTVQEVVSRATATRPARAVSRYLDADGELLAAGMSFQAIFAVFAAIYVAFAVAGIWLTGNPELFDALVDIINQAVPNLIGPDGSNAIINTGQLTSLGVFGWTGAVAAAILLFTMIGWLASTRLAIRSIFDLPKTTGNIVLVKLSDLALALGFGALLLIAAVASVVSTQAMEWLLGLIGIGANSTWAHALATVIGALISVLIYTVTLAGMYRLLARIPIPRGDLLVGSLVAALALYGLSVASGAVLGGASRNPLLATFAALIGLMIWFNFVCRVILAGGAWIAAGLERKGVTLWRPDEQERARQLADAAVLVAEDAFAVATANAREAGLFRRPAAKRALAKARDDLRAAREHRDELAAK